MTSSQNKPAPENAERNAAGGTSAGPSAQPSAELLEKLMALRIRANEVFGRVVIMLMAVPRYRHLSVADLQGAVLDPLLHDRIMFAQPKPASGKADENAAVGMAIWASVSAEVDAKIMEQIKAGVFPVRLQPADWTSGKINWLLDVIAPNAQLAQAAVISFRQFKAEETLRLHPMVARALPKDFVQKAAG